MGETWLKVIHFPFRSTTRNNFWSKTSKTEKSGLMRPPCWIEPSSGLSNDVGGRRETLATQKNPSRMGLYRLRFPSSNRIFFVKSSWPFFEFLYWFSILEFHGIFWHNFHVNSRLISKAWYVTKILNSHSSHFFVFEFHGIWHNFHVNFCNF